VPGNRLILRWHDKSNLPHAGPFSFSRQFEDNPAMTASGAPRLGIRANLAQFSLLTFLSGALVQFRMCETRVIPVAS
jgi:hypothetical protein